jgi:flagellar basal body rod protein FlgC
MYDNSISGIRNNLDLFAQAAKQVQNFEKADLPAETAKMIIAEKAVEANVQVLCTSSKMSRYLVDIVV